MTKTLLAKTPVTLGSELATDIETTLRNAPTADRMEAMTNDDGHCSR
jgi:hypothetical protein